ncbi:MAG: hypothetical protein J5793_04480, partial [Clostridia bacterium]|nr:hypothetical protein [Clostridia bacterium]
FAIKLFATQLTYEDDSIDDQYDADANLPVIASQTITAANADDAITVEAPNTGVAVVVPADDTNEGDTYMLEVSNQSVEQNDMGETTVALDAELFKNNVKVENSTTVYDLTFDIGAGATITSVKHNDTALTAGTRDGHYEYDSATGILTIHTRSFSPFSVEFTGPAAVIGDVKYETVAAAFAAAVTGDTVKLIRNSIMPGNAGITVPAGKELTLDLNGFKFSNAVNENKASQVFMVIGTLTIKDTVGTGLLTNGIEEGTQPGEWWSTPQYNYVSNTITNCGTVIVESGKITNTAVGSICYCIDNNSTSYDVVLNIKGGLIEKDGTAVRLFCNSTVKNNTLIMEGGKIKGAYTAFWVQLPGSAGAKKLATLDISGGVIEADTYSFYDYSYGDVFDEVVYDITGGTFLSERGVYSYGVENFILGGLFEYEPDEDYIAGGYCAEQNGEGLWEVKVEESILA